MGNPSLGLRGGDGGGGGMIPPLVAIQVDGGIWCSIWKECGLRNPSLELRGGGGGGGRIPPLVAIGVDGGSRWSILRLPSMVFSQWKVPSSKLFNYLVGYYQIVSSVCLKILQHMKNCCL